MAISQRFGNQEPNKLVLPDGIIGSDGMMADNLLKLGGINLMDWQRDRLGDWLSKDFRGSWAARSCGMSVPRQNGKTCVVAGRCDWGMTAYAEWIVYTAHLQKTATETFEEMANFFETGSMASYVKDIKTALGREEIRLNNGGRIKFLARTRNGGRGQHGDLLIFDEAQELTDEQQASFLPCLAASRNSQTLYLGTPPDENSQGEVFRRIRDDALNGKTSRMAWSEWGVEEFDIGAVGDRDAWADTNPSYGYMIQEDTVETELEQMAPDKFARERLGWWSRKAIKDTVIDAEAWASCETAEPPTEGVTVFAAKFEPGGAVGTICSCVKPKEGKPHIEFIESEPVADGMQWMVDFLTKVSKVASQIVVDGGGFATDLTERLLSAGVSKRTIVRPRASDMSGACAKLLNAVNEGSITHYGQEELTRSATESTKRRIGTDGWGFSSTENADSTLIEACALAHWQALVTRRNPTKGGKIG